MSSEDESSLRPRFADVGLAYAQKLSKEWKLGNPSFRREMLVLKDVVF